MAQNGLHFRRKEQPALLQHIKQWFHTNPVSCQKQSFLSCFPNTEGKNSVELFKTAFPPLRIGMQHHLRIGMTVKAVPILNQSRTYLFRVIQFSVIHQNIVFPTVMKLHRLRAAGRINDRQTAVQQAAILLLPDSCRIGSPPRHGL